MPTTCHIAFENPSRVYYAGQLLRGTVNLTLTKEKKVRGVYVRIYGRAYAYWTEYCSTDHNRNRNRDNNRVGSSGHHVSYTGEEVYLDERQYFVGGSGSNEIHLTPGTHQYTFQVLLPAGLPTSVEHSVGHITYSANVVLDIPMWPDKEFKEHFTVIKSIDLNYIPSVRSPVAHKNEETFYPLGFLCCFPDGPLFMEASIPVGGYAPGQTVNVSVNVRNDSKQNLSSMGIQLNKQITFFGSGMHDGRYENRTKVVDDIIAEETIKGCRPGEKDSMHVNLHIPSVPPTDFSTSRVVQVKYMIRVDGAIESCCRGVTDVDLPITIGSIPIHDNFEASAINPGMVISGQPMPMPMPMPMPPQNQIGEASPMLPPSMPMTMPPLPNQNGNAALPYPSGPSAPFPSVPPPNAPHEKGVPGAPPSAPPNAYAPNAPSAPNFNENPPSYEDAINPGDTGNNSNNFKPKYPMFRRDTSYSIDKS